MPIPVSWIVNINSFFLFSQLTSTELPSGENLIAFEIKFVMICRSIFRSTLQSSVTVKVWVICWEGFVSRCISCITASSSSRSSAGVSSSGLSCIFPSSILPRDKKSSRISFIFPTALLMRLTCFSLFSKSSTLVYLSMSDTEERMVLNGVRNSCEAMVTNRDFKSPSCFSFSNATWRLFWYFFISEISTATPRKPEMLFCASRKVVTLSETVNVVPFLRTYVHSCSLGKSSIDLADRTLKSGVTILPISLEKAAAFAWISEARWNWTTFTWSITSLLE